MHARHRSGVDPLAPGARAERVRSWGPTLADAQKQANSYLAEFERRFGRITPAESPTTGNLPTIPESRCSGREIDAVHRIAPVFTDDATRRAYSLGKSFPDLMAARSSSLARAADMVLRPTTVDEAERALHWLCEHEIAVVPVGGGTSVVGGIEPIALSVDARVAAMDVTALNRCLEIDPVSRIAHFEAGVRGPDIERSLSAQGLTLGHMPQSFEYSTLGGWIAARSAGQASMRFGRIEQLTAAASAITPHGRITIDHLPAHASGPDALQVLLGSEGTLGLIATASVRVVPRPERVRFATWIAPSFEQASECARMVIQRGIRPGIVRVSNATETSFALGAGVSHRVRGVGSQIARATGYDQAAMIMVVSMGDARQISASDRALRAVLRTGGARPIGPLPARHWYHGRFVQPYARDHLIEAGLVIDTLETSVSWRALPGAYHGISDAIRTELGPNGMVGCHISHLYPDGASLYFTFMGNPQAEDPLEMWRRVKAAANAAIVRCGAAVSHQHGIGTMHAEALQHSISAAQREAWMAFRQSIDHDGMMNPGKLFAAPQDGLPVVNAPVFSGK